MGKEGRLEVRRGEGGVGGSVSAQLRRSPPHIREPRS